MKDIIATLDAFVNKKLSNYIAKRSDTIYAQGKKSYMKTWVGTTAEYEALTLDPNTIYILTDGSGGGGGGSSIIFSDTAPLSPTLNQIWVNTLTNVSQYWDGSEWQTIAGGPIGDPGIYSITGNPLTITVILSQADISALISDITNSIDFISDLTEAVSNTVSLPTVSNNISGSVVSISIP